MKALRQLLDRFSKTSVEAPSSAGSGQFDKSMMVCYVRTGGCDFYKVSKAGISPATGGAASMVNKITGRNILVIGKELLYYWREKYPPLTQKMQKNLKGMIANDLADMFPMIANPVFHFNVFESHVNFTLVDIWAWERSVIEGAAKSFYSNYLVAEDLLFVSPEPEATIYAEGRKIYAFAHGPKGFIGFRTLSPPLSEGALEVFLRSLGGYWQQIRRINLCGINSIDKTTVMDIPIEIIEDTGFPESLRGLKSLRLAPFRTKTWHSVLNTELALRVAVYSMAAYMASSYLSMQKLDTSLEDIERETAKTTKKINELVQLQDKDVTAKLLMTLSKKVSELSSPLDVLGVLTKAIAEGSYVTQLIMNNRNADVNIVSGDPSGIISKLSGLREVESVKLVGEPSREGQSYRFRLSIDMRESISDNSTAASSPSIVVTPSVPQAAAVPGTFSKTSIPAAAVNANPNSVGTPQNLMNKASSPSAAIKSNKIF